MFFRRPKGFTSIYEHISIGNIDIFCVDPFTVGQHTLGDCGTVGDAGTEELYAFFIYLFYFFCQLTLTQPIVLIKHSVHDLNFHSYCV